MNLFSWSATVCVLSILGASMVSSHDSVCLPPERGRALTPDPDYPRDCADIRVSDRCAPSGVYRVYPKGFRTTGFEAYCDMATDDGGWTVIQRRECGCVDFYRNWTEYTLGFGCLMSEHWIGNNNTFSLTNNTDRPMTLRVDLGDWSCPAVFRFAQYATFSIASESDKFRLHLTGYSGNAGDAMTPHSGGDFSTFDRDNDVHASHCAKVYKGAWWYTACHSSNLNGLYHQGGITDQYATGAVWRLWKGYKYSLKRIEMKIRPKNF